MPLRTRLVFDGHNDVLLRLWQSAAAGVDPIREFTEGTDKGHLDAPRARLTDVSSTLRDFVITTYDVAPETLASFLGVNVVGYKVAAYVISSMLAAMVGCAYAPVMSFISPELLSAHETISLIGVLILGGIGTVAGPIIGTIIFFGIPEVLRVARLYRLVVLGVVILVVVLFMPRGVAGVLRERLARWKRGVT